MAGRVDPRFRDWLLTPSLRVVCRKCGRAGRYRLDKLIAKYGWDFRLQEWASELSRDCPRRDAFQIGDRCYGPSFPDLMDFEKLAAIKRGRGERG